MSPQTLTGPQLIARSPPAWTGARTACTPCTVPPRLALARETCARWLALVGVGSLAGVGWRWLALAGVGWRWLALVGVGWRWLAVVLISSIGPLAHLPVSSKIELDSSHPPTSHQMLGASAES